MQDGLLTGIGIIVKTLLRIGELVLEVDRDHIITQVWTRDGSSLSYVQSFAGKKMTDTRNDGIVYRIDGLITAAFASRTDQYLEQSSVTETGYHNFSIRVINEHPDTDRLFIVVEVLPVSREQKVTEDKWKLALDASGDGMWDINLETGAIFFSEKWHEIFGYSTEEITTAEEWGKMIHPDDLAIASKASEKYLSGETGSYTSEIRYRCKDGSWKWILSRGVVVSRDEKGKPERYIGTHTDINERKMAEERYASTAQLLAKLINNLQSGIIVTDQNWQIIYYNEMFANIYKSDPDQDPLEGLDMKKNLERRKFAYKDPDGFFKRTIEIFEQQKIVLNDELELVNGRIMSRDFIPLTLGQDNMGGIWKFTDITMQKESDRRFEEQRLFYERILNNIPADIAVFDAEHRYLFVNKNAFKNDDLRKWMIGRTDIDYAQYSNRSFTFVEKRFALYDGAMNAGKEVEYIEPLSNRDGKETFHLRLVRPVYFGDGALEFLMAYGVEITELIVAQEGLKTSINTFSSAFDHSGIGMALLGLDGRWINVNKVLCGLTGYAKDELEQLSYHDITLPEDDEMDRPLINKLLSKEISTYTVEKRYVSRDKKIVLVALTVSLVWQNDKPQFFIAQVVDITQTKALENEIRRKNIELEATRISLVNKVTQLEELSHIIAHNLRGPAGNVKMFSGILLAKETGDPEADNNPLGTFTPAELVKFINDSSISLMDSLNTLMEITEIKLNKEIPYNDCDVASIVNGIATQLQSIIFEKNAHIILDLGVEIVNYPKVYLENILYNLVSNALKYSNTGIPPEITIATKVLKNKKVQLSVKDNGLGIDLDRFGHKVFKLNQIFHTGYDSKGVGLYITKTQIESLGGTIAIKSKVGEGCEFIVTL